MKKTLLWIVLLVACTCLVLAACDGNKQGNDPTDTGTQTAAPSDGTQGEGTNAPSDDPSDEGSTAGGTESEPHVHAFGDWSTVKDATCTEAGEQKRTCECGESETQSIDALGHTEVVDEAVAPTCTETGLTEGKHCSVCEEVLVAQEVVAASHKWSAHYERDDEGHWHVCSVCDESDSKEAHDVAVDGFCSVCDIPIRESEGVQYLISADGTYVEVIDYVGDSTKVNIAAQYEGLPVKVIGDSAFEGKDVTIVLIPEGVETIGRKAFAECCSLKSITIPDSVTRIHQYAFRYCTSLTSITIGNGVIGIADDVFYHCTSLTSITIPDGVIYIGTSAFGGCISLADITIPDSVTSIGHRAFSGCNKLIEVDSGVSYVDNYAISCSNSVAVITLRENTRMICDGAFKACTKLRSVSIPNSVTSIGHWAFEGCSGLTNISIPDSVTNIGDGAFEGCSGLTNISIPDSVTSIGDGAFYNCRGLTSITLPCYENINFSELFGDFSNVPESLKTIVITSGTSIRDSAFSYCTGLTSITIPDSVKSIGNYAFYNCHGLTSMTIPDSVTSIGSDAFYECTGLTDVYYTGTEEEWAAISVGSNNSNLTNATIHYNYVKE